MERSFPQDRFNTNVKTIEKRTFQSEIPLKCYGFRRHLVIGDVVQRNTQRKSTIPS